MALFHKAMWIRKSTPILLLGPIVALNAYCEVYVTEQKATELIFPGVSLAKKQLSLTSEDRKKIEELSGESVRSESLVTWVAKGGECVFIDQVLGKHEMITFAVGVDAQGKVKGVEIIEYRESYGQQVHEEKWRSQFVGKDKTAVLKVEKDITNISGATLSSAHITGGVRRLIQTYEQVKSRLN